MNIYFITSLFVFSFYTLFPADDKVLCHPFMEESKARRVVENIEHLELRDLPEIIRTKNTAVRMPYRTVVLHGEPGTGKTTLMEAVATLVGTEWGATFITKKDLNAEPGKRGATMKAFCDVLKAAQQQHKKNMILMSEFHVFLNQFNSENHDTDEFSTAFQDILDENKKTNNMFFIATVNDFDKVAKPIKDRLLRMRKDYINFLTKGENKQQLMRLARILALDSPRRMRVELDRVYKETKDPSQRCQAVILADKQTCGNFIPNVHLPKKEYIPANGNPGQFVDRDFLQELKDKAPYAQELIDVELAKYTVERYRPEL